MRIRLFLAVFFVALLAGSTNGYTQAAAAFPPAGGGPVTPFCHLLTGTFAGQGVTACAKPLINRQSLNNTSTSIRNIIVGRFDAGPDQTEPAGLELTGANEIIERLSGDGSITIAPTADLTAPAAATPKWNIWTDGKYSWLNDTSVVSDLDGDLVNLILGADYKVSDRLVIGLLGTYESSNLNGSGVGPASQDTDGWGGGAYIGLTLTDNLVFSANVLGTSLNTNVNGGFIRFDSDRVQTSEALTGYWYSGTWRFSPSLTFAWSKEWQDASAAANAQTIETIVLSPAVQIGKTVSIGGASTVEPWLGAEVDVGLRNRVRDSGLGVIFNDPETDLRLQTGLNFAFGANAQLALTGEISGLLLNESDTYTAGANFAYQF